MKRTLHLLVLCSALAALILLLPSAAISSATGDSASSLGEFAGPVGSAAQDIAALLRSARSTSNALAPAQSSDSEPVRCSVDGGYLRSLGAPPGFEFPVAGVQTGNADATARSFLSEHTAAFGISNKQVGWGTMRSKVSNGRSSVRFQQTYAGIPVFAAEIIVQLNESGGVQSVLSDIATDTVALDTNEVSTVPSLSPEEAQSAAIRSLKSQDMNTGLEASVPVLTIYEPSIVGNSGPTCLVWDTTVTSPGNALVRERVFVSARTAEVVFHYPLAVSAMNRQIYDSANTSADPGTLRRSEGQAASGIADVDKAYDYFGDTYSFYYTHHGRDSINGAGMALSATTRFCEPGYTCPYANAYWNGSRMYLGDGFVADDVVGHELTHGVTQYESNLVYANQSGAMNESFSDIWGEFIDLTNGRGNDTPAVKWLCGEDLAMGAIRSLSNPPAYSDPDRMGSSYYYTGTGDGGGVHTNSGVGNKLAYLLTDGATFNGQTVQGMGIDRAEALFYEAQTNLLTSGSNYADLNVQLTQAAVNLGWTPAERSNLRAACLAVEIAPSYSVQTTAYSWIDPSSHTVVSLSNDSVSSAQSIPFAFKFYGNTQSQVYVGSNGLIAFSTSGATSAANTDIPATAVPNNAMYPYWDDLDPGSGGSVRIGTSGTAPNRRLVISWVGVPRSSTGSYLTFQVLLCETTNKVVFQYQEVQSGDATYGAGRNATVGMENPAGSQAAKFSYNGSTLVQNNLAILFQPSAVSSAVSLDRDAYGCSALVGVTLSDSGLIGAGSQGVTVSSSNGDSEPLILTETPVGSGSFAGGVHASPNAVVVADGTLQLVDGATITVTYQDADDGSGHSATLTDTATVDCLDPAISNVQVSAITGGSATVTFTTSELATGRVRVGRACGTYDTTVDDPTSTTAHTVQLTGLGESQAYFFAVEATDMAGNTATDNNGGTCWSFTTTCDTTPPVITHTALADTGITAGPYQVCATVTDNMAVGAVTFHYRKNGGAFTSAPMAASGTPNQYCASIPGPSAVGDRYCYYIEAADSSICAVNTTRSPATGENCFSIITAIDVLSYIQYADTTATGEYQNTLAAIRASYTINNTELTDYTQLSTAIAGKAVLLVPEQEKTTLSTTQTIGTAWKPVLQSFLASGGRIVVCDYYTEGTYGVLTGAGLMSISAQASVMSQSLQVSDPTSPIATGVVSPYTGANGSCSYTTTETGAVVTTTSGAPVVISKPVSTGYVTLIGHDYYQSNASQNRLVANAVCAAFPGRSLCVVQPNGGNYYEPGNTIHILWTAIGSDWLAGDTVSLEYSTNGGAGWSAIPGAAGLAYNAGSFNWDTTGLPGSSQYRVRVVFSGDASINDGSDSNFTIACDTMPPVITHTALADTGNTAGPYQVCATVTDNMGVGPVTLHYSKNGGSFTSAPMAASGTPNQYCGNIPGPSAVGDRYCYYIEAADSSTCAVNTTRSPASGESCFNIIDCRPPAPTNPTPADGATGVSADADLSWVGGASMTAAGIEGGAQHYVQSAYGEGVDSTTPGEVQPQEPLGASELPERTLTGGVYGVLENISSTNDTSAVTHIQAIPGLSASILSWATVAASTASALRAAYDVIYFSVSPGTTDYANLRAAVASGGSLEGFAKLGGVLVLNFAGNNGNQIDVAPGGLDYNRATTHDAETFASASHPYITGTGYGGTPLTVAMFASWGSTDHGTLDAIPAGSTSILLNTNGVAMAEYRWGSGMVIASSLTFGWGGGAKYSAQPFDNQLLYAASLAGNGTRYDVYMGDSCASLTKVAADLYQPTYNPPAALRENTTYYWKVVAKNDCGETPGPCWSFTTSFDTTPPVITHTPLADTGNATGPYSVCALVTDNLGVGPVTLYWNKNGGSFTSVPMAASGTPNQYCGNIPGPSAAGDRYCYYITATDISAAANTTRSPATGENCFSVTTCVTDTIGSTTTSTSASAYLRGNVFACTSARLITKIEHYLNPSASTELRFFVYESTTPTGTYNKIHETMVPSSGTGLGWYSSGPISVQLTAGRYYIIGTAWQGSCTYYYASSGHPVSTAFGQSQSGYAMSGYPPPSTVTYTSTTTVYYQRITTCVVGRALEITRPHGGEWYEPGQTVPIQWAVTGTAWQPGDTVRLDSSTDGGTSWNPTPIASSLAYNAGSYNWDTTGLPLSSQYRVRVVFSGDASINDGSDSNFTIAFDTTPPVITHTPLADTGNATGPYSVCALVTDNMGVGPVTLYWNKNGGSFTSVPMAASGTPNQYCGNIPGPSAVGDRYCYYITATDVSAAANTTRSPATGENCFNVVDLLQMLSYIQYTDTTLTGEYQNTLKAIAAGCPFANTELTNYTALETALVGKDVLLIPEQEASSLSQMQTIGTAWRTTLEAFLSRGGRIVVCDFTGGSWGVLASAGLMSISGTTSITDQSVQVSDPLSPIAAGVTSPYIAMSGSVKYTTTETGAIVRASDGAPVVIVKAISAGHVILLGHDYYSSNASMTKLVANAVCAAFPGRSLCVVQPNGGNYYEPGNTIHILWTAIGSDWLAGDTVSLEYSTNGGAGWSAIPGAAGLAYNAGSFNWDTTGLPGSGQYRVRVVFSGDASINDGSDSNFTIACDTMPPVITHTALADTGNTAGPYQVCATVTDNMGVGPVTLHYSKNGGSFTSIPMTASGTPNQYCGNIPGPSAVGDRYCYYIEAADSSTCAVNTTRSPASGESCFNIIDCRPPAPTNPTPADGATGVSADADLSWVGGASMTAAGIEGGAQHYVQSAYGEGVDSTTPGEVQPQEPLGASELPERTLTGGVYGVLENISSTNDTSAVTHIQAIPGLSASILSWATVAASTASALRAAYDVIYFSVSPGTTDYANLRAAVASGGSLEGFAKLGGVLVLNFAGNNGNQIDVAPGGLDYNRATTHDAETFASASHPYITGTGYGGTPLTVAMFASWGSTDHGTLDAIPAGSTSILLNTNGVAMAEYRWGSGMVIASSLTFGWGGGAKYSAQPFDNQLLYAASLAGNGTRYDVYMGDSCASLTKVAADLYQPTYNPPAALRENTTYYWKVVAKNDCSETPGPCWSFTIACDTVPPVITHTALADTLNTAGPYQVCATVTDNMAVGAVTLHYSKNGGSFTSVPMTASGTPNQYCGNISGPSVAGDRYCYYIEAADSSTCAVNTTRSPATGENCFNIIDCRPPVPTNPTPADGATSVSIDTNLSWTGGPATNAVPTGVRSALESILQRSGIYSGPVVVSSDGLSRLDSGGEKSNPTVYSRAEEIACVRSAKEAGVETISTLNVAICAAESTSTYNTDIQAKLLSTGMFNTVSIINVMAVTPTLAELQAFDAVQVHSNSSYLSSAALGDVMAGYVDAGGGVVCMMFEINASLPERMLQGRWASAGYFGVPRAGTTSGSLSSLGVIHVPGHPILDHVSTFNGGSSSYRPTSLSIVAGWTRVADWSDGRPLVVTKDIGAGRVADLCFFPPSSDVSSGQWPVSTDGALLMANSLVYVSRQAASSARYDVYIGDSCGSLTRVATDLRQPTYDPPGNLQENTAYYWKVVAKNDCGDTAGPCWSFTTEGSTIAKPKDGSSIQPRGVIVSAVFPDCFYVESVNRVSGIRVAASGAVAVGDLLNLTGTIRTTTDWERYLEATDVTSVGSGSVDPVTVSNKSLGGGNTADYDPATGAGQRGVSDGVGLNNIGLLVRVSGRVTAIGSDFFYVDDGTHARDASVFIGVRVTCGDLTKPAAGSQAIVTGISSMLRVRNQVFRSMRPRTQADIQVVY